jgi:predicted ATP-dependent serine protease
MMWLGKCSLCQSWVKTVGEYIKEYNFAEAHVFNIDETRSEPENTLLRDWCVHKKKEESHMWRCLI